MQSGHRKNMAQRGDFWVDRFRQAYGRLPQSQEEMELFVMQPADWMVDSEEDDPRPTDRTHPLIPRANQRVFVDDPRRSDEEEMFAELADEPWDENSVEEE